ncbi:TPA: DUF2280 domain-containing protein [Vibrio cholerae]
MAALSNDIKAFVVQALACFDSPSTVVAQVKQEFSFDVSIQQVSAYDPTKAAGQRLSQKWIDLFNATRERFQSELSDIPIANKAYRLRALDRMATKAENMRNFNLTAQLIEQAAKECGDSYTNKQKHEHSGAGGGPIETLTLSKDEYKKARQEMLEDDDC